jgi:hypothetical protein
MAAKTALQKADRSATRNRSRVASKAGAPTVALGSAQRVITQNLVNMAVVMAGSGIVLLGLLAAKHFQIASF